MDNPRSFAPIIAAILLLLPVLYVGSYLALVVPNDPGKWVSKGGGVLDFECRHYRVGGSYATRFYWPLEQIDRRLRPWTWEVSIDESIQLIGD